MNWAQAAGPARRRSGSFGEGGSIEDRSESSDPVGRPIVLIRVGRSGLTLLVRMRDIMCRVQTILRRLLEVGT
jgi:hypothetical protein